MKLEVGDEVDQYRIVRELGQALANVFRSKWSWLGLGAAAVIAIAVGAWFLFRTPAVDDASFYDHLYDIPSCLS